MTTPRQAFTLFELIVAIALSAVLLVLIGTAINLYLVRVDAGRQRVEEAQLARSVLAMIAADLRAAAIYRPQDTSSVAALAAARAASANANASSSDGATISTGGTSASSSSSSGVTSRSAESTTELQLGVNGTLEELYVDACRLPRMDELFATHPSTANGAAGSMAADIPYTPRGDETTVRYFVRQGEPIEPNSVAATSLAPEAQLRAGGLVRQEADRAVRVWAERSGNEQVLETGQQLVAPEVVGIRFRYFDGADVVETWDMQQRRSLPAAVEVRVWIVSTDAVREQSAASYSLTGMPPDAREYQQTVYLPLTAASQAGASVDAASGASSGSGAVQ
jgi:prepilin-type N-terminal cleavage/methylation domain-containing protein